MSGRRAGARPDRTARLRGRARPPGPVIASEAPIRGIAVYGTVAKAWTEFFLENWRRQAALAGNDPTSMDSMLRDVASALHYLLMEQKEPDDVLRAHPGLRSILAKVAPRGKIVGRSVRFWSQLATRNLPGYWAKGNAHVLAIWGRNDFIATEADHPLIAQIVNKARPGKGTYVVLDGSDHAFRKTISAEDSFARWNSGDGEFDPQILTTLKEWIEKVRTARDADAGRSAGLTRPTTAGAGELLQSDAQGRPVKIQ